VSRFGAKTENMTDEQSQAYSPLPEPAMPAAPRRHSRHVIGLSVTAVAALAIGATVGTLSLHNSTGTGATTATSTHELSVSQIASRVDPGLVDVISTLGYQHATAEGTGIVLTSNGEILTNNHVIAGATSVSVRDIGNGNTYRAKVVGYDEKDDVAVLQLSGASGLTTASTGDSSTVQTGNRVVALGNAGGHNGTPIVAAGSVTGLNQSITASDESSGTSEQLTGMIETNANIQAGDSGGALVNEYGQIIGMNTAAYSGYTFSGGFGNPANNTTQGFAIPIDKALTIAKQIESGQSSDQVHIGATGFLGVALATGSAGFGATGSGVYVQGTEPGLPAYKAGLTQGDTITSVAGQSVNSEADVQAVIEQHHPGDKITITWTDINGNSHSATVTLATGPSA
jgi:S1-C subfamily serine protease